MSLCTINSQTLISWPLLLISVCCFIPKEPKAQVYDFNTRCIEAYHEILNFRFKKANELLSHEKQQHPGNLIPVYLENYIDFLVLFTSENNMMFEQAKIQKGKRISLLDKGPDDSPYHRFCIAGVKLQWALVRMKFGEYATAGMEARSAYLSLTENQRLFPGFIPDYIGLGILHVLFGLVPDQYQWLVNLIGAEGSVPDGVAELQHVLEYQGENSVYRLFKPEASFYLAFIDANLLHRKQPALTLLNQMKGDSTYRLLANSPLVVFARASILMKAGLNDEVMNLFMHYSPSPDAYPFAYLDYMKGLARLQSLDYRAIVDFDRFLTEYRGMNYIKSAYQKKAWCLLLQGDTAGYRREIYLAGTRGYAIVDEDKQAYSEYNVDIVPAIPLVKARLLYDGGYYRKALAQLLNTSLDDYIRSRKDLTEYTYRLARIYHGLGEEERAISHYTRTIELGKRIPHYYAASAALQLGLIYESKGDLKGADTNFRICASLKHDEYENSLCQKAKAGLYRIQIKTP